MRDLPLLPASSHQRLSLLLSWPGLVNIQGIGGQLFKVNLYLINIHETLTVRNDSNKIRFTTQKSLFNIFIFFSDLSSQTV